MKYKIEDLLKEKILVLDGAMGTAIQKLNLGEEEFSGGCNCRHSQKGNNDILNITHPEFIKEIHQSYLQAGADIIETNTFNGNRISQADYALENKVYDLNYQGAKIARQAADEYTQKDNSKPRFVAGSIGPTNKTASLSPDVENPGIRNISFDEHNARAAIIAADNVLGRNSVNLPIMISGTITDKT